MHLDLIVCSTAGHHSVVSVRQELVAKGYWDKELVDALYSLPLRRICFLDALS